MDETWRKIPGAPEFVDWFGRWPQFHDAEVVGVSLLRGGITTVDIHVFNTTAEVDDRKHYVTEKHALVRFSFGNVMGCELAGFNHQNVIGRLDISKVGEQFQFTMDSIYGLGGSISADSVTLTFTPGIPEGSIYPRSS